MGRTTVAKMVTKDEDYSVQVQFITDEEVNHIIQPVIYPCTDRKPRTPKTHRTDKTELESSNHKSVTKVCGDGKICDLNISHLPDDWDRHFKVVKRQPNDFPECADTSNLLENIADKTLTPFSNKRLLKTSKLSKSHDRNKTLTPTSISSLIKDTDSSSESSEHIPTKKRKVFRKSKINGHTDIEFAESSPVQLSLQTTPSTRRSYLKTRRNENVPNGEMAGSSDRQSVDVKFITDDDVLQLIQPFNAIENKSKTQTTPLLQIDEIGNKSPAVCNKLSGKDPPFSPLSSQSKSQENRRNSAKKSNKVLLNGGRSTPRRKLNFMNHSEQLTPSSSKCLSRKRRSRYDYDNSDLSSIEEDETKNDDDDDEYEADSSDSDEECSSLDGKGFSEDEHEGTDEEKDEEKNIEELLKENPAKVLNKLQKSKFPKTDENFVDGGQSYKFQSDYYFRKKLEKSKTSNNTLSRLKSNKLSSDQLDHLLSSVERNHRTEKQHLFNKYKSRFNRWLFYLREGFSLLLYGLGSKRTLLNVFHTECLSNSRVLIVNGFFPDLSIKDILNSLLVDILKIKKQTSDQMEMLKLIKLKVKDADNCPVFILMHNIDGIALRAKKHQSILAKLASTPNIHLIASFDHINAPLLWGSSLCAQFNFLWINVPTFEPYRVETSYETSLFVQGCGSSTSMSSLLHVFASLPSNTQKIFQLIIKDHLNNKANKTYRGVMFSDLYRWSRDAMLVASDLALRTQLTEFVDHQLLKWRNESDILIIPIPTAVLAQFYENNFAEDELL